MFGCMRTTLTLEPDVAAALERWRAERGLTLKGAVNEALRAGVRSLEEPKAARRATYATPTWNGGRCLLESVDDVSEALAHGEGERFR